MPRTGIVARPRPQPPAGADGVADFPRHDPSDHLVHGLEAGRLDDGVGCDFFAIGETDAGLGEAVDVDAALHPDLAIDDELRPANVDIVAGARAVGLHHQAGLVRTEV